VTFSAAKTPPLIAAIHSDTDRSCLEMPPTSRLTTANCSGLREHGDGRGCDRVREGFHHGTEP
jgi:hypothetical protein